MASTRAQDLRRMAIATPGAGERQVFVSYVSAVPVWKTTYRLVLPSKADSKPLLQGWAIVDNTLGEDWQNVQLSLVAGAPQSFVQRISQPYYVDRPRVELPERVTLTPQTHAGALTETIEEIPRSRDMAPRFRSSADGVAGGVGDAPGGAPGGRLGGVVSAMPLPPSPRPSTSSGRSTPSPRPATSAICSSTR
jgi:hypothetical protein